MKPKTVAERGRQQAHGDPRSNPGQHVVDLGDRRQRQMTRIETGQADGGEFERVEVAVVIFGSRYGINMRDAHAARCRSRACRLKRTIERDADRLPPQQEADDDAIRAGAPPANTQMLAAFIVRRWKVSPGPYRP